MLQKMRIPKTALLSFVLVATCLCLTGPARAEEQQKCAPPAGAAEPAPASFKALFQLEDRSQQMEPFASGMSSADRADSVHSGSSDEVDSKESKWAFKGALLPGPWSRFLRPLTVTGSSVDQLDRIYDGTVDPETGFPSFTANPAGDLGKIELTVKPKNVFRSTAELKAAYSLALDDTAGGFIDASSDPLRVTPSGKKLSELAWAGRRGVGKRLLSAFEATFGYSERSPFAGALLLDEEVLKQDDDEFVYSISLDLDSLVIFPAEVGEAYDTLEKHTMLDPRNRAGLDVFINEQCAGLNPIRCLREMSGIRVKGRWLAGLLPKITYKTVDQFDFIVAGGEPFPFNEDSIETFTVTWDLGSALDSAKHRRAAVKALAQHQKLAARDDRRNLQPILALSRQVSVPHGFPMPIKLPAAYQEETERSMAEERKERKPQKVTWTLEGVANLVSGQKWEDKTKTEITVSRTGELSAWKAAPGRYRLRLCMVDDVNNYSIYHQLLDLEIE